MQSEYYFSLLWLKKKKNNIFWPETVILKLLFYLNFISFITDKKDFQTQHQKKRKDGMSTNKYISKF